MGGTVRRIATIGTTVIIAVDRIIRITNRAADGLIEDMTDVRNPKTGAGIFAQRKPVRKYVRTMSESKKIYGLK
jgi:hypothetical protein